VRGTGADETDGRCVRACAVARANKKRRNRLTCTGIPKLRGTNARTRRYTRRRSKMTKSSKKPALRCVTFRPRLLSLLSIRFIFSWVLLSFC